MRPLRLLTPVLFLLAACPHSGSKAVDKVVKDTPPVQTEPDLPLWKEIHHGVLDNGLTYYVIPHQRPQQRAYLWLALNAGSLQEDDDQLGLAHFVEHMAFNGTTHFEHQEIVKFMERIGMSFGADLNASTWYDETIYKLALPTDDPTIVETGFDILRDWASEISFDQDEFEKERGVVLEEWRLSLGAGERVWKAHNKVSLKGSRYADRDTIGDPEILKHASLDTIKRFYKDWYRPDLMAVIVVGDLDVEDAVAQIKEKFGDLKMPDDPRPRVKGEVPPADGLRVSIVTDDELPNTVVQIVNQIQRRPESTKSDYRRFMIDAVYSRMLNDRLQEIAQRPDAPFLYAGGGIGGGGGTREIEQFSRTAVPKDGKLDAAFQALLAEVVRIERHGFTETELERAKKAQLRFMHQSAKDMALADGIDLVDELTRTYLEHELNIGRQAEAELGEEQVPTITLDEVNKYAASFGGEENRVILISGPKKKAAPTDAHVRELIATVDAQDLEPWVDNAGGPLIATAPTPGTITKEETRSDGGVTWTLSNGAKVAIKTTDFEADTILFSAFSPGGTAQASDKLWPSARFAAEVVGVGGVGAHSAVELDKLTSANVASVGAYIGETEEGLYGSASGDDLEVMMQLAWLKMTAPRKDESAFEVWKQGQLEYVANRRVVPENEFYEDMGVVLSKGHARRTPPEAADIEKVDLDQALAFYQDRFGDATDFTFVVVGNVDVDKLRPLVETYLASLPAAGRVETEKDIGVKRPKGVTEKQVLRGTEPKSNVYLTFHGDQKWSKEDAIDIQVLAGVLDIKLREILREKMSGTYGVGVWGWVERRPHPERVFQIEFGCAPENVDKLEKAMFEEFEDLKKNGVDQATLDGLVETYKRNHDSDLIDNRAWAGWLADSYRYGDDMKTVMDVEDDIKRITSKNVQAAAKKFLDKKAYVLGELFPEGWKPETAATKDEKKQGK